MTQTACKFKHGDAVLIPLADQRTGKIGKVLGVVIGSYLRFGVEKVTVRHPNRNVSVLMDGDVVEHYVRPEVKVEKPVKPKRTRKATVKKVEAEDG